MFFTLYSSTSALVPTQYGPEGVGCLRSIAKPAPFSIMADSETEKGVGLAITKADG